MTLLFCPLSGFYGNRDSCCPLENLWLAFITVRTVLTSASWKGNIALFSLSYIVAGLGLLSICASQNAISSFIEFKVSVDILCFPTGKPSGYKLYILLICSFHMIRPAVAAVCHQYFSLGQCFRF